MNKVLVIEDEEAVRANIVRLLKLEDYEAIGAENGAIGVQAAQEHMPDLIICDVMMPELDGYGVLNALRENPSTATIPFIFLTAKATKEDIRQGMQLGASDYLNKPFTRDELLNTIKTQLEKQAAFTKKTEDKLAQLRSSITLSLPHELRTPLNGIIGLSELLKSDAASLETEEVEEMAEAIYTSARRLNDLIENFLLYAELEVISNDPSKIKSLRNDYTDFTEEFITEVARTKSKELGRKADLQLSLIDAPVQIAETDLKKIVEELTDNAFKYSPPATPVIIKNNLAGNKFILQIVNRGRGMTLEQIKNLGAYMQFERQSYAQEGSGLGLIIVKRLVELYGGEFNIESVPDGETMVQIALPM